MNRVERSHRSRKGRWPWGALVPGPGKSARNHREERAAPGRAGSPRKDRVRLETGRFGQWSCPVVRFLAYDDRQYGGNLMRLATDPGCIQRWVILELPLRLIVWWSTNNILRGSSMTFIQSILFHTLKKTKFTRLIDTKDKRILIVIYFLMKYMLSCTKNK